MITLTLIAVFGLIFVVFAVLAKLIAVVFKIAIFPVKIVLGIVFGIIGFVFFTPLAIFLIVPAALALIGWLICKATHIA